MPKTTEAVAQEIGRGLVSVPADVAHWARIVAAMEQTSISKVLEPLLRDHLRSRIKKLGLDPDEVWRVAQSSARNS